ncbi:MFS transporter [Leucobacter japonicus]|uniref:MFS transporter n=1 Tax=Leucobacter japonicus TaxID=1461259 RepID=UPI000949AA8C|nr:MFS transporter [Leucobacter japonicus]
MSHTKPAPMRKRVRGRVLFMLCIMYGISYIDRTNISTALPFIKEDLGLTDTTAGYVIAAFALPYAFLQIFGGAIGGRIGPRKMLAAVAILWGVATVLTGFSVGVLSLIGARLLLGLTEAAAFPTATQAMSRWIPLSRNGFAQGITHSAARLGNALAPLIVAGLIVLAGWRVSFFAVAALSVVWAIAWWIMFRDNPADHPKMTTTELTELGDLRTDRKSTVKAPKTPWKQLVPQILPVTLVDFGYGWTLWVFLTWLPTFLSDSYGLGIGGFALYTSVILLAGVVGDTVGGVLSDRVAARGGDLRHGRRVILVIGLGGALICLTPLLFAQSLLVATVALTLSFFFLELCNANLWAIPMDVAPQWSGAASGLMNTGFGIAGVMSPIVFGTLIDASGWVAPFALSIGLLGLSMAVAWFMNPKHVRSHDGVITVTDTRKQAQTS